MSREPLVNPINLRCADCGFEWTNMIWLPLDAGRFARALKQLCECPACGATGKKILMGHDDTPSDKSDRAALAKASPSTAADNAAIDRANGE